MPDEPHGRKGENGLDLQFGGLVERPRQYIYDGMLSHQSYSKLAIIECVEGWNIDVFREGMMVRDLFQDVGVKSEATFSVRSY